MKRALIVLLLLAVAAGGLFAQVTFGGHFQSGLEVVIPNDGDTTLHWFSRDAGIPYRFQLNTGFTNESGKAGASAEWRINNGSFGIDGARAWAQPLDILRIQFGTGGIGGFNSPGDFDAGNNAAGGNFSAVLTPALDGATFSLGLGVVPANTTFDKSAYGFGVKFGLPGTLEARANLGYNGATEVTNVAGGVIVSALNAASGQSGLTTLILEAVANNVTDLDWIGFSPVIGLRVADVTAAGALSINLRSRIFVPMKDTFDFDYWVGADFGLPLTPTVTANLSVGYEADGVIPTQNADNGTLGAADRGGTGKAIGGSGDPALVARPSVTFNIGGGSLETGWSIQALMASEMVLQHAIYAYYRVNF
jgi:hypothetical protein